jgi:hypothetical protein
MACPEGSGLLHPYELFFPFHAVQSKLSSLPPDFTIITDGARYPCSLAVVAACCPTVLSAAIDRPDLSEFTLPLSDSDAASLIAGTLAAPPYTKLTSLSLRKTLNQLPRTFKLETPSRTFPVHRTIALALCRTTKVTTEADLSEIAEYLSGGSLSVDRRNLTNLRRIAGDLGIDSLLRPFDSIAAVFARFARPFAVASLHRTILSLSESNFAEVLAAIHSSPFYQDPAEHITIAEFLLVAARVRPGMGTHFERLIGVLSAEFRATMGRTTLNCFFARCTSNWLTYRLLVGGVIAIDDVIRAVGRPRLRTIDADFLPWLLPEIIERDAASWERMKRSYEFQLREAAPLLAEPLPKLTALRSSGFNPDPLITALRSDDLETVEAIVSSSLETDLRQPVPRFCFDSFQPFLGQESLPLVAIPLFFGAVRCVRWAIARGLDIPPSAARCALMSGCAEVIRLVEDRIDKGSGGAGAAISAHRNDVVSWLAELRGRDFRPHKKKGDSRFGRGEPALAVVATDAANLEALLAFAIGGALDAQAVVNDAVGTGMTEVVRLLLLCGARRLGEAVVVAVERGHLEMVRLLIEEGGAGVSERDPRGRRPIDIALADQDPALVRLIAKNDPTASEGLCGAVRRFFETCMAQDDTA